MVEDRNWIKGVDYPEWMTEPAIVTLKSGYIPEGYTPKTTMELVGRTVELELGITGISEKVFNYLWEGYIGLSSPIWSNFGRKRGLPISCFNSHFSDSILDFKKKDLEVAIMSKNGGGTSGYFGDIRGRGSKIANANAKANGVMSPIKMVNNTIEEVSQGGVRRGMLAGYLDFSHPDIMEFLDIREVGHDIQTITTGVVLDKADVDAIMTGDTKALDTWAKILEKRNNIGVPYIYFKENCENGISTPEVYKRGGNYPLKSSNLCSEIILPSKSDESFVCCLLSMNLAKYDDWKNTDAVEVSAYILEAVLNEFIRKASKLEGMEAAVKFAERHRAIGIGTLGEHTYFQQKRIPFLCMEAEFHRKIMYKNIRDKADKASIELADIFGPCDVNAELGIHKRFTTTMAVAPTTTNALICGEVSPGIEPLVSNVFQRKVAKGSFLGKNKFLVQLLRDKEQDTAEVWESIIDNFGSVQHLDFLTDDEKELFLTAYEMNQFDLIKQASVRQEYIDQSQSLNLFVLPNTPAKVRSDLYLTAYLTGVKTLYYQRSLSNLVEDKNVSEVNKYFNKVASSAYDNNCSACEG